MFVGRENELLKLNSWYQRGGMECVVIYGRKRVGKTSLINQFVKGKTRIFFQAIEGTLRVNAQAFAKCMEESGILELVRHEGEKSLPGLLDRIFEAAETHHLILVLDECQKLSSCWPDFLEVLETLMEKYQGKSRLFLILSSSSVMFANTSLLSGKNSNGQLRGSIATEVLKMDPFDFFETKTCLNGITDVQAAMIYALTGGSPDYLQSVDKKAAVERLIRDKYLTPGSRMYEDPTRLFYAECRDSSGYHSVMHAISKGAVRMAEICQETGMDTALVSSYVNKLLRMDLIIKESPVNAPNSRKTAYEIKNPMLGFWYRFVYENISQIEAGNGENLVKTIIPQFSQYMESVFKKICMQFLIRQKEREKIPVDFKKLGCWWETDPVTKKSFHLEIVGLDDENRALIGACFWNGGKTDMRQIAGIMEQGQKLSVKERYYYIFSRDGYTKECMDEARKLKNIVLVAFSA